MITKTPQRGSGVPPTASEGVRGDTITTALQNSYQSLSLSNPFPPLAEPVAPMGHLALKRVHGVVPRCQSRPTPQWLWAEGEKDICGGRASEAATGDNSFRKISVLRTRRYQYTYQDYRVDTLPDR